MSIIELIEQLKAMPEKMEGFNSEGELVVLNTHKLAESLKKSLRNCDLGTAKEQDSRHSKWCRKYGIDGDMEVACAHQDMSCTLCALRWAQMPYEEGGAK